MQITPGYLPRNVSCLPWDAVVTFKRGWFDISNVEQILDKYDRQNTYFDIINITKV